MAGKWQESERDLQPKCLQSSEVAGNATSTPAFEPSHTNALACAQQPTGGRQRCWCWGGYGQLRLRQLGGDNAAVETATAGSCATAGGVQLLEGADPGVLGGLDPLAEEPGDAGKDWALCGAEDNAETSGVHGVAAGHRGEGGADRRDDDDQHHELAVGGEAVLHEILITGGVRTFCD